jgi:hypothetical protein
MDDPNEIAGRIGALAVHIDARRWADLQKLFASELQVDWTSLFGGEPQRLKREELVGNWRQMLPGFTHTTHLIGPPTIALSGEGAQASASVVAWHFIKEPGLEGKDLWLAGGTYEIDFAKLSGAWRITAMTLARAWSNGNQDLPQLARERAARIAKI